MPGSVISGWWSWLVACWAVALVAVAILSLFEDQGTAAKYGGALFLFALGALAFAALMIRQAKPRTAAWLLIIAVGVPGIGFFWAFFIPTGVALVIVAGGLRRQEIAI